MEGGCITTVSPIKRVRTFNQIGQLSLLPNCSSSATTKLTAALSDPRGSDFWPQRSTIKEWHFDTWYMCLNNTWFILIQRYNQKLPFSSQERSNWLFLQQCSRTIFWLSREREHVYDSRHSLQETLFNITWSCLFHAFSCNNFIFNFPSNFTCTIEYLYWIFILNTKCLLYVSAVTPPSAGRTITFQNNLFIARLLQWLS